MLNKKSKFHMEECQENKFALGGYSIHGYMSVPLTEV